MKLRGRSTMSLRPDLWELEIFTPPSDILDRVQDAEIVVEGEDGSTLGRGRAEEVYMHEEDGKDLVTVLFSDGMDFWLSTSAFSLSKRNTVGDCFRGLASKGSCPTPIASMEIRDVSFLRGQTFYGRTAGFVSVLAKSVGARAYYTRGALNIAGKGIASDIIRLAEGDLLNGVSDANGAYIVQLSRMIGYPVGQLVALPNSAPVYRLLCQSVDADNYQGSWKTELILVDEAQILSLNDWSGG